MRKLLLILAVVVALGALSLWAARGAHRGWTMSNVPEKVVDEVTGIEGVVYRQRWVPGLDFLGGGLLAAGLLAGSSAFCRQTHQPNNNA